MGDGDLTALAQSLYDRITEYLEHSEEFTFFRVNPDINSYGPSSRNLPYVSECPRTST